MDTTEIVLVCVGAAVFLCACCCCICCYPLTKKQHSKSGIEKKRVGAGDMTFENQEGCKLHYVKHIHPDARASLFLVHGFGEHVEREGYKELYRRALEHRISVFAMTHQGHGKSYGDRGVVSSFSDYANDQVAFIKYIIEQRNIEHKPIFLMGHSLGSAIATDIFRSYPNFNALIISGCVWHPASHIECMDPMLHCLSGCVPKLQIGDFDPKGVTRNQTALQVYIDDPLVHGVTRARFGSGLIQTMNELTPFLKRIIVPVAMFHGAEDPICLPSGAQLYHDNLGSKQKSLKFYKGMEHEPFEDDSCGEFFADLFDFIEDHLNRTGEVTV